MQADTTALLSEQLLTWINERLREELDRRYDVVYDSTPTTHFWQRQATTVVTFLISGLCWLAVPLCL